MMGLLDVAAQATHYAPLLTILGVGIRSDLSDCVRCSFLLHDPIEGTVCGWREFPQHTQFTDMQDFVDELWASDGLFQVVGNGPPGPAMRRY